MFPFLKIATLGERYYHVCSEEQSCNAEEVMSQIARNTTIAQHLSFRTLSLVPSVGNLPISAWLGRRLENNH